MIIMRQDWNLRSWYDWLEDQDLQIGRDWCWAWKDDCWAIEFRDPRNETAVRLKATIE